MSETDANHIPRRVMLMERLRALNAERNLIVRAIGDLEALQAMWSAENPVATPTPTEETPR